ncbi:MAG: zinc ribbon domain-containing protein, partial [Acidimicrobiia bacterium]
EEILIDVEDVALGHETRMRWNDTSEWVWSSEPTHEAIVTREQFDTAQHLFDRNKRATHRTPAAGHRYLLSGILHCGICGRRMQAQWNHDRAYYRCRYRDDYVVDETTHPKSTYVREDAITPGLDAWLASLFDDVNIDNTCAVLAGASEPDPESTLRETRLREAISECDRKLAKYRALLDQDDGVVEVAAKWIAETERERKALQRQLGQPIAGGKLSTDHVKALATALRDIVAVLADAEPADRALLYEELGVTLTYDPSGQVHVQALPRGVQVRVGGGT